MTSLQKITMLPPRALGFGLWWMWIYLAILSPTFAQSPLAAQPMGGAMFSFMTIASGAAVYALAIPVAWKLPQLFQRRATAWAAGIVASASTAAMAFSALLGSGGGWLFTVGSLVAGAGISVLYLQWGAFYTSLRPKFVAPCTVVSFLLAIVGTALVLDRGLATSLVAIAIPLAAAGLLPFEKMRKDARNGAEAAEMQATANASAKAAHSKPSESAMREDRPPIMHSTLDAGSRPRAEAAAFPSASNVPSAGASLAEQRPSVRTGTRSLFPLSVMALILVFSFAFGLFRVLISPDDPSGRDMGLLLLCSAGMALAMLCIVMVFSVSLGWDSIVYLALPLIAAAALVLSVVDFGDRSFVWAIVVAAIRVADLIMWMIFASLAHTARRRSPIPVFAFGKLLAQMGVLVGILVANVLARAFDVESLLLPTALAFLVLVTVFGSFAAIKSRMPLAQRSASGIGGVTGPGMPSAETGSPLNVAGSAEDEDFARTAFPDVGFGSAGGSDAKADSQTLFTLNSSDAEPIPVLDAEASAAQARIRAIARQHGLSPRETEIFELLARGRTIPYIADELVLANSTVTTHVRGLYRKLDVHNRQELLDFVEAYR